MIYFKCFPEIKEVFYSSYSKLFLERPKTEMSGEIRSLFSYKVPHWRQHCIYESLCWLIHLEKSCTLYSWS